MIDEQFFAELEARIGVPQKDWDDENPKELIRAACQVFHDQLCHSRPELRLQLINPKPPDMATFWSWVKTLRTDFPAPAPYIVSVRTKPFGSLHVNGCRIYGCATWLAGDRCRIDIERNQDIAIMVDTLWHEWAHAVVGPHQRIMHTRKYWKVYGRIFNRYTEPKAVESTK